jgi:hypothetical protein
MGIYDACDAAHMVVPLAQYPSAVAGWKMHIFHLMHSSQEYLQREAESIPAAAAV